MHRPATTADLCCLEVVVPCEALWVLHEVGRSRRGIEGRMVRLGV